MGKKTYSQRYAMQPIVNILAEDQATDAGNMHKKFGKDRPCGSRDIVADRQTERPTDTQTDILITLICTCSSGRSNKKMMTITTKAITVK